MQVSECCRRTVRLHVDQSLSLGGYWGDFPTGDTKLLVLLISNMSHLKSDLQVSGKEQNLFRIWPLIFRGSCWSLLQCWRLRCKCYNAMTIGDEVNWTRTGMINLLCESSLEVREEPTDLENSAGRAVDSIYQDWLLTEKPTHPLDTLPLSDSVQRSTKREEILLKLHAHCNYSL